MDNTTMEVSVIIPTTRDDLVKITLKSIKKERFLHLEIIKVPAARLKLNPAQARNWGAKHAKGELLLFLDDDCEAKGNWIKENIKTLNNPKVGAVGGRIEGKSKNFWAKVTDFSNFTFVQTNRAREMPVCTASFGIRRKVFERIGGFDEKLAIGEDVDLCLRLNEVGLKTVYNPRIKVWHNHGKKKAKQVLEYQYRNGRIKGLTIEKRYPENLWFKLLNILGKPRLYWIFVIPFALLATIVTITVNIKENPEVLYLSPGIFLAKLACQIGIFVWLINEKI